MDVEEVKEMASVPLPSIFYDVLFYVLNISQTYLLSSTKPSKSTI
jgi:hypothetical protein